MRETDRQSGDECDPPALAVDGAPRRPSEPQVQGLVKLGTNAVYFVPVAFLVAYVVGGFVAAVVVSILMLAPTILSMILLRPHKRKPDVLVAILLVYASVIVVLICTDNGLNHVIQIVNQLFGSELQLPADVSLAWRFAAFVFFGVVVVAVYWLQGRRQDATRPPAPTTSDQSHATDEAPVNGAMSSPPGDAESATVISAAIEHQVREALTRGDDVTFTGNPENYEQLSMDLIPVAQLLLLWTIQGSPFQTSDLQTPWDREFAASECEPKFRIVCFRNPTDKANYLDHGKRLPERKEQFENDSRTLLFASSRSFEGRYGISGEMGFYATSLLTTGVAIMSPFVASDLGESDGDAEGAIRCLPFAMLDGQLKQLLKDFQNDASVSRLIKQGLFCRQARDVILAD